MFSARFEVLLYDFTSTYFESDPPGDDSDKRRHGYSRDKRSDCVQVVIALVVTPDGFPLAYHVLPGNTSNNTTLRAFLSKIQAQYGKAERIWVMDRGIPTEEVLAEMRQSDPPIGYLVGAPKGRLGKLEKSLVCLPWHEVRPGVEVKLLAEDDDLYVFAQSRARIDKERAMRKRQLKGLSARLAKLTHMHLTRESLLMELDAARAKAPAAWRLLDITVDPHTAAFTYALNRKKLRRARRAKAATSCAPTCAARSRRVVAVLHSTRRSRGGLQEPQGRSEATADLPPARAAHRGAHLRGLPRLFPARHPARPAQADGVLPHPAAVLDKLAAIQMLNIHFPTTDRRTLILSRTTEPNVDQKLLLRQLGLTLPPQPPPRIAAPAPAAQHPQSAM